MDNLTPKGEEQRSPAPEEASAPATRPALRLSLSEAGGVCCLDFLDSKDDLIYAHDLEGHFLFVNKAVERLTGFSRREALEMGVCGLVAPEYRESAQEMILEAYGGVTSPPRAMVLRAKDDRRVALEFRAHLVFESGKPAAVHVVARDVARDGASEREPACRMVRECNAAVEMVTREGSLEDTLDRLILMVERHSPGLAASVMLVREERLKPEAHPSLPVEAMPCGRFREIDPEAGCCGAAACLKRTVSTTPLLAGLTACCPLPAGDLKFHACVATPILARSGDLLGVFAIHYTQPVERQAVENERLELASRLAALAIEQWQLAGQLDHLVHHDAVTGLPNRARLLEWLKERLAAAGAEGRLVAVAFLGLDRFKQVNDSLGHAAGDALLAAVGQRLKQATGERGMLARIASDEFAAVVPGCARPEDGAGVAAALMASLRRPFRVGDRELVVTASLGLSLFPRDAREAGDLLSRAEAAMYRAKDRGGNDAVCFTGEIGARASDRLTIENHLRPALGGGELRLCYQPQFTLDGELVGLEALLVWENPVLGRVPPKDFIPVAEECGLIVPIGAWVLREACRQNAFWQRSRGVPLKVSVNVSALQFERADFVETVAAALSQSALAPRMLELELTESLVMRDIEESARRMEKLRALGVSIAIDDFGTGYSSLNYLRRLPVDTLKIDQSFVREIAAGEGALPLIQTMIALAHDLGLTVVAEGVETAQQANLLRQAGCDKAQGHHFGGPLEVAAADALLAG